MSIYIKKRLFILALTVTVAENQRRRNKEANVLDARIDKQTSNAWVHCKDSLRVGERRRSRILGHVPDDKNDV